MKSFAPAAFAVALALSSVSARGAEPVAPKGAVKKAPPKKAAKEKSAPKGAGGKNMTKEGVQIVETKTGAGAEAKAGKTVVVHYVGTLNDAKGKKFDSSRDRNEPFSFELGEGHVIRGWDVGVEGMKVGGVRQLTIPADKAYGNRAVGGVIPANSTLYFEVELLQVK